MTSPIHRSRGPGWSSSSQRWPSGWSRPRPRSSPGWPHCDRWWPCSPADSIWPSRRTASPWRRPTRWLRAAVHAALASMAENDGDLEEIRRAAEVAYAGFAEIGDRWGLSASLSNRARVASLDGRLDDAVADFRQAAVLVESIGSPGRPVLPADAAGRSARAQRGPVAAARAELVSLLRRDARQSRGRSGAVRRGRVADAGLAGRSGRRPGDPGGWTAPAGRWSGSSPLALRATPWRSSCRPPPSSRSRTAASTARRQDLEHAYRAGVGTRDMPVLAAVGLDVAALAAARGRADDAATVLGARAQIRGADDPGDLVHTWVQAKIEPVLGAERYAERYAAGRQPGPGRGDQLGSTRPCCAERLSPAGQARRRYAHSASGTKTTSSTAIQPSVQIRSRAVRAAVHQRPDRRDQVQIGLTWTKACSQPGIVSVGTKVLLPKLSGSTIRNPMPCTAPGGAGDHADEDRDPAEAEREPDRERHRRQARTSGSVWTRNPMIIPAPRVTDAEHEVAREVGDAPLRPAGADRAIGSERNRSKMPFSMSVLRLVPRAMPAMAIDWPRMPGSRNCR